MIQDLSCDYTSVSEGLYGKCIDQKKVDTDRQKVGMLDWKKMM